MSKEERMFRNVFYAFALILVGIVFGYWWAYAAYVVK